MHYIYKITNLVNGKVYIGQSIEPQNRWSKHKSSANGKPTQAIHHAMKKYGIDNFQFECIASCLDQDAANEAETAIVAQENSLVPNGYNVTNGGYNSPKTQEWKDQMSLSMKGKNTSPETQFKNGHSQLNTGRTHFKLAQIPHNKRFTEEDKIEIKRLSMNGMSARKIAVLYQTGKTSILRILNNVQTT